MYDEENEDLAGEVTRLKARLAELEERVARLESGPPRPLERGNLAVAATGGDELVEAINQALVELVEADAGAIRQHLIKNGQPASLARSDVNKQLYRYPDRFQVGRQEGAKPVWKLAGS